MQERTTKIARLTHMVRGANGAVATILFGCSLVATSAHAATYYVAKNGGDSNSCTQAQNIVSPKLTLGGGVSCMKSGDTLYIRAGTYNASPNSVIVPAGTSWSAPTTIARYGTETVVIQPNSFRTFNATTSYAVFDGLIFDGGGNGWSDGISIGQGPHHLRFTNFELRNVGANGISVTSSDNEFLNCKIHDGGTTDFDNTFYILGSNNVIDNCEIYNWAGAAVQIYNGGTGGLDSNVVSRNRIHDTSGGVAGTSNSNTGGYTNGWRTQGIIVQDASNTRVWGNVIYNLRATSNPRYAILAGSSSTNTKIYNNTIFNNPTEGVEIASNVGSGTDIKNNILYNNSQANVLADGGASYAANLCGKSGTGCAIVGNPGFVDPSSANVRLAAGSLAVNAGLDVSSAGVALDIDGTPRPQNGAYDLGAFEQATAGIPPAAPTNLRLVGQ